MTAPDPGLTDLIAAHLVETVTPDGDCGVFILDCTCGAEVRFTQADLNAAPVDSTAGALHYMLREHVAVVLEQHTNGRITELGATVARVEEAVNTAAAHRFDFDNASIEGPGGKVGGPNNFFNGNRYVTNYVRAALEGES